MFEMGESYGEATFEISNLFIVCSFINNKSSYFAVLQMRSKLFLPVDKMQQILQYCLVDNIFL